MSEIGVVGIPEGWSSLRMVEAINKRGGKAGMIDMRGLTVDLSSGHASYEGRRVDELSGIIIRKIGSPYSPDMLDRLSALCHLADNGLPMFSNPHNIKNVLDRLSCTVRLRSVDAPMPPTVITENVEEAAAAIERFGKAVLKPLYTSKARGMIVVESADDIRTRVTEFQQAGNQMMYIQKMLKLPGKDLGVVFLGGEYLACYARVGGGKSWNTTTHSGGRYESHEPTAEIVEIARNAQAPFGLDFTCVDVAEAEEGVVVFEVSAFGGFRGLWEGCKIDAADRLADYVMSRIGERS